MYDRNHSRDPTATLGFKPLGDPEALINDVLDVGPPWRRRGSHCRGWGHFKVNIVAQQQLEQRERYS